ncbi:hypothetical protein FO519_007398 [Halicephalobus sp. NKZ332]|nr:hypothetical protein FO519_007398 [Halicephalobus sp. NKZ332]
MFTEEEFYQSMEEYQNRIEIAKKEIEISKAEIEIFQEEIGLLWATKENLLKEIGDVDGLNVIDVKVLLQRENNRLSEAKKELQQIEARMKRETQSVHDQVVSIERDVAVRADAVEKAKENIECLQKRLTEFDIENTDKQVVIDSKRRDVNKSRNFSEKALLKTIYELERQKVISSICETQENIAGFEELLAEEIDNERKSVVEENLNLWRLHFKQLIATTYTLREAYKKKEKALDSGTNFNKINQFDVLNFNNKAIPLKDLVLPSLFLEEDPKDEIRKIPKLCSNPTILPPIGVIPGYYIQKERRVWVPPELRSAPRKCDLQLPRI